MLGVYEWPYGDIKRLLRNCESSPATFQNSKSRTALSLAVENKHSGIVKILLGLKDKNVDTPDRYGWSLLFWTVEQYFDEPGRNIFELLVSDPRIKLKRRDRYGRTILSWAAEIGAIAMVELLLALSNPAVQHLLDDVGDDNGRFPLSWAAWYGQVDMLRLLCSSGRVDAQLQSVDQHGQNVISLAADRNHPEGIKLLAKYDPDGVDRPNSSGRTPLSCAMWGDPHNGATVRALLQTGLVNVNYADHNGRTPLSHAAASGRPDLIRILANSGGADLDSIQNADLAVDWRSESVKEEIAYLKEEFSEWE